MFSTKGKSFEEIDPTLFAKGKGGRNRKGVEKLDKGKDFEKQKDIAALESQIYRCIKLIIVLVGEKMSIYLKLYLFTGLRKCYLNKGRVQRKM